MARLINSIIAVAHKVGTAFAQFDEALLLDPKERSAAQKMHGEITEALLSAGVISAAFLQGSFARKTMIAPLRDIDKVVILASRWAYLATVPGGPDKAMDLIQAVIAGRWPTAKFERTRHSLKVDFGETGFSFDIVPGFETDTEDDDVNIADRETGGWRRSNTRSLLRAVRKRDEDCDGRFVHQARMVKSFGRNVIGFEAFPGLHVEAIAYLAITKTMEDAEAVAAVLTTAVEALRHGYFDPTGVDCLSDRLDRDVRQRALTVFVGAAERAQEALRLQAAGDEVEATRIWSSVLGPPFPGVPPQTVDEAFRRVATGGSITSIGTASSTTAGRQPARATRSWGL